MFALDARSRWIAAFCLAVLMAATRIHHFGIGTVAPEASTAVFFFGGLLLSHPLWFIALMIEAILLDAAALGLAGVADACMTLGYWLLFAGYLTLWYAGHAGRQVEKFDLAATTYLIGLVAAGTALFFVLSNVGYYYGGGFDATMGAAEYTARVSRYFGHYLLVTFGYVVAGMAAFAVAMRLRSRGQLPA